MLTIKREESLAVIEKWRSEGLSLGFTSGVFDLLHIGHVRYLEAAKSRCDRLIVAVNSDKSVKANKGSRRPLVKARDRLKVIASLKMVDLAFIFEERNNNQNISLIKPNYYFKSKEYLNKPLTSSSLLENLGGETILIDHEKGSSTTELIEKILNVYSDERPLMEKIPLKRTPAVFLDRDGVINEEVEYLHTAEDFQVLPGVYLGLKKLQDAGFKLIIVTTQAGIGLGYFDKKDFFKVNKKMLSKFHEKNIIIDKVYFCPHSKNDKCSCRKPGTLLFERAAVEANVDLSGSYMIGDKTSDIKAGDNLALSTILVQTGHAGQDGEYRVKPDYVAENLEQAAKWIIQNKTQSKIRGHE